MARTCIRALHNGEEPIGYLRDQARTLTNPLLSTNNSATEPICEQRDNLGC